MNTFIISGRLTKDPVRRATQSGAVMADFTVAVKDGKDKTYFIDCRVWNNGNRMIADWVTEGLTKGKNVYVQGKMTYTDGEKDGIKRRYWTLVASDVYWERNDIVSNETTTSDDIPLPVEQPKLEVRDGGVVVTDDYLPF